MPNDFLFLTLPTDELERPLKTLELPTRAYHCLMREEDISTVGDLLACSESELIDIRIMGSSLVDQVKIKLAKRGWHLSPHDQSTEPPPGDSWVQVPHGQYLNKQRQVLQSRVRRISLDRYSCPYPGYPNTPVDAIRSVINLSTLGDLAALTEVKVRAAVEEATRKPHFEQFDIAKSVDWIKQKLTEVGLKLAQP